VAIFTFTITARTLKSGENATQERAFVVEMMRRAIQQIGNGTAPLSGQAIAEPGAVNPANCSYAFGAGSLNVSL
jgi:hypothetical protein